MMDKEFLKRLTILYVEDEEVAREQCAKSLKRLFKNVILAINGEDGYNKFKELQSSNQSVDLILSDINMPKMNGLEMLEKIRLLDENVPVMYTTARTETEYLQKAIELHVEHYALKPINMDDIIYKIKKICEKKYYQNVIDSKNLELKNYLNIINKVSAIYKFNEKGEITFINNLLSNLFEEKVENLQGKEFSTLFHPHVSDKIKDEIFATINKNETWNGDIKYENSSNKEFYVRSSIFKLTKANGFEYISIGFLSTEEVERQRKFHKNVLQTISTKNKEATESKNDLQSLLKENKGLKEKHIFYAEEIKKFQYKISFLKNQVDHYEKDISDTNEEAENKVDMRKNEIANYLEEIDKLKVENRGLISKNTQLEITTSEKINEAEKLTHTLDERDREIKTLSDMLDKSK